ncbi:MAG: serine hydrolase domain-containing protein [Holophagae bacterium]|jgi:D-alanyl-D-alanine carboxypeptidase
MGRTAVASLVLTALVVAGCSRSDDTAGPPPADARLQALVDSIAADDDAIHGAALAVISPSRGIDWAGAAGVADPATGSPMTPDRPVRIASNTKTYVATAVLRLAETGRIDLDAPIDTLLPGELIELLASDGYDPSAIRVRHLLTHTGGLDDHGAADNYTEAILADPTHHWTPAEQVRALVDWCDPVGEPGRYYSYSDTGYVLLGVIVERLTGDSLASAVRRLDRLDELGLAATWWEILEPAPTGVPSRAHQFYGEVDVTDFVPYFDLYGGGGIATTVGDLVRFFDAVFRGRVFDDPAILNVMLSTIDGVAARPGAGDGALPPGAYRMGVWVLDTDGLTIYQHSGFWGTTAVHVPVLDLTFAATVDQNRAKSSLGRLQRQVIAIVRDAPPTGHPS